MKIVIIWTENLLNVISSRIATVASIQLKCFASASFHLLKAAGMQCW